MSGAAFNRGNSKQDYATPENFIYALETRWGKIDFDLAASEHNKKAEPYFSKEQNSLVQSWSLPGNLFLNPTFDNIAPWAQKCAAECATGSRIFFLVPASVGSNWFRDFVHRKAMVYFLNGRISFDGKDPYPKDCLLAVYSLGYHGYDIWTWK